MASRNSTVVVEFILLGLSSNPKTQAILFAIFMLGYVMIFIANILFIMLILTDTNLHTPMYFFLLNLSFLDLCYSTSVVPRTLKDLMSRKKNISYAECVTQMYFSLSLGISECFLLAVMAYDRMAAICNPLRYTTIMTKMVCVRIGAGTWVCGFLLAAPQVALTFNVDLCGNNKINHFACEIPEILSRSCDTIILIELVIFVMGVIVLITPVTLIFVSYIKIILSIFKITSSDGRSKAFSTCGSHMIVVIMFFGSAMSVYMKPRSSSTTGTDKVIAIFYVIVPPMLNPVIYTLRNSDVKAAFWKCTSRYCFC